MLRFHPVRIALGYVVLSALWILFSDKLVFNLTSVLPDVSPWLHTLKGWFFVAVSALALWKALQIHEREILAKDAALNECEQTFRSLFQYVPMPICLVDEQGRFLNRNDRFAETFGYEPADLSSVNAWWGKAYPHEPYRNWVRAKWNQALETAKSRHGEIPAAEYQVTCKNGEVRTVVISGVLIGTRCLAIFRDVTEHKAATAAKAALRASEQSNLDLLENMREGVAILEMLYDDDGQAVDYRILSVNKGYERILGKTKAEVEGRLVREVFGLSQPPDLQRYLKVVETGQPAHFDSSFQPQNLSLQISSYWTGGHRFAVIFSDVTAAVAARAKLAHQTALLSALIDSSPDLIFIKDLQGVYLECNPAFARFVGVEKERIIGRTDHDFFDQDIADFFRRQDYLMLEGAQPRHNDEWISYPDASVVLLDTLKAPLRSSDGEVVGILGIGRDITERFRLEQELRDSTARATAASQAKSLFLANMSHEIRTPLNGLMGMLHLLKLTDLNEEQQGYVGMAVRSGRRLNELLSDILDLSRIEAGAIALVLEPFRLNDILDALRETFETLCAQKEIALRIEPAPGLPDRLVGDEMRVRQVLFNIVGNAIKFSGKSDVKVEVYRLPAGVDGLARILFMVGDKGVGIADDQVKVIFEAFSQVQNDYTRTHQGAGLGLSIARRLVSLMGGTITVESEPGLGTTVYLMLPFLVEAADADQPALTTAPALASGSVPALESAPAPAPSLQRDAPERSYRILLAEDDYVSMKSVHAYLTKRGHTVLVAEDGDKALELLRANPVDCVFMDVQMGEMSGLEATRRIREDQSGDFDPRVPVVAMTAYAMSGDKERFLAAGMDGYLAKPVDLEALIPMLRRLVGARPQAEAPVLPAPQETRT